MGEGGRRGGGADLWGEGGSQAGLGGGVGGWAHLDFPAQCGHISLAPGKARPEGQEQQQQ